MKLSNLAACVLALATSCCAKSLPRETGPSQPEIVVSDHLPFELVDMNTPERVKYKTADHVGAVFVLEAYGNFCGACNDNAPNVHALAEERKDDPRVQVLDISMDQDDEEYLEWISRHGVTHPVLADKSRGVLKKLKIRLIPTVSVLSCEGKLLYQHVGVWSKQTKADLKAVIDGALASCPKED